MSRRLADAEVLARFDAWFKREGHWVFSTRERALDHWLRRGMNELPEPTPALREQLRRGLLAAMLRSISSSGRDNRARRWEAQATLDIRATEEIVAAAQDLGLPADGSRLEVAERLVAFAGAL